MGFNRFLTVSPIALVALSACRGTFDPAGSPVTGNIVKGPLSNALDAVYREEKQSYMYAIEVELINSLNDSSGASVPLNPGMIAQVDIIRGQQTVLEYFWQPIAKLKDDAFRQ